VASVQWEGTGPEFSLIWGGRRWSLSAQSSRPGLCYGGERVVAGLLTLDRLSEAGRSQSDVFVPDSLVGFELHRSRVLLTFAPAGWGGVVVRTGWGPGAGPDSIDLEVQVTASSVGQLQNLEVGVASGWPGSRDDPVPGWAYWAEPRDLRSAALSYDGREPEGLLQRLTTGPVAGLSGPRFLARVFGPFSDSGAACYVEMVQPNDPARRITGQPADPTAVQRREFLCRYALFGHDLEKGVVLRARLRGQWLSTAPTDDQLAALYHQFVEEALPLGP
jgi:hypothetical protein